MKSLQQPPSTFSLDVREKEREKKKKAGHQFKSI